MLEARFALSPRQPSVAKATWRSTCLDWGGLARRQVAIFALATLLSSALAAEERPRVLVTNDDGWDSPGLATLVAELAQIADVVVSAPTGNRSGSSQSLGTIVRPFEVEAVSVVGAIEAWAVDGTPAAAAAFGLARLGSERPFDIVISGINLGENVGVLSHVSGTVGAAMQAASMAVPAIAVSQAATARDYGVAARLAAQLVQRALAEGLAAGLVLSVNVPAAATTGEARVVVRPMGGATIELDAFAEVSQADGVTLWRTVPRLVRDGAPAGSDTEAFLAGAITVTPLRFDWTAHERLEWVEQLLVKR